MVQWYDRLSCCPLVLSSIPAQIINTCKICYFHHFPLTEITPQMKHQFTTRPKVCCFFQKILAFNYFMFGVFHSADKSNLGAYCHRIHSQKTFLWRFRDMAMKRKFGDFFFFFILLLENIYFDTHDADSPDFFQKRKYF